MKNINKKIIIALLSAACLTSAFTFAACGDKNDTDTPTTVAGEKGDKGDTGAAGTNGTNGATWTSGTTAPEAKNGNEGDFYLDSTTCDIYKKGANGWEKIGNLKGTDGNNGADAVSIVYATIVGDNLITYYSDGSSTTAPIIKDVEFTVGTTKAISLTKELAEFGVEYKFTAPTSGVYSITAGESDTNYDVTLDSASLYYYSSSLKNSSAEFTVVAGQTVSIICKGSYSTVETNGVLSKVYNEANYSLTITKESDISTFTVGTPMKTEFVQTELDNDVSKTFAFMPTEDGCYQFKLSTTEDSDDFYAETFLSVSSQDNPEQILANGSNYESIKLDDDDGNFYVYGNLFYLKKGEPIIFTVSSTENTVVSTEYELTLYKAELPEIEVGTPKEGFFKSTASYYQINIDTTGTYTFTAESGIIENLVIKINGNTYTLDKDENNMTYSVTLAAGNYTVEITAPEATFRAFSATLTVTKD